MELMSLDLWIGFLFFGTTSALLRLSIGLRYSTVEDEANGRCLLDK